jgi:hypothetical protein
MSQDLFDRARALYTADDIKDMANRLVYKTGNPLDVYSANGGPAAHVIRRKLLDWMGGAGQPRVIENVTQRLLIYYGLNDWTPTVAAFREALALTVALKRVLAADAYGKFSNFSGLLSELVKLSDSNGFKTPDEIFALPYEKAEALYKEAVK